MTDHVHDGAIRPGVGVGAVHLGETRDRVLQVLGAPAREQVHEEGSYMRYPDVTVIVEDDTVIAIVAESSRVGSTPSGVRVGSSWRDLVAAVGPVLYDEEEMDLWYAPAQPGVWYELVRPVRKWERSEGPTLPEVDEVVAPDEAFVDSIFVTPGSRSPDHREPSP